MTRARPALFYLWSCLLLFRPPVAGAQEAPVPPQLPPSPPAAAHSTGNAAMPPAPVSAVPPVPAGAVPPAPAVTAPAGTAPSSADAATSPPPPATNYSYGDAPYSLFYTPAQIEQMKAVLKTAEDAIAHGQSLEGVAATIQKAPAAEPPEPANYPIFYLSSIVYHGPDHWTIWVEQTAPAPSADYTAAPAASPGEGSPTAAPMAAAPSPSADAGANGSERMIKLTPQSNAGELTAVAVAADKVDFSWKPEYLSAMAKRAKKNLFASADKVQHRAARNNTVAYHPGDTEVDFSLRENQSFAAAYLMCFEGRVHNAALQPLAPPPTTDASGTSGAAGTAASPDAAASGDKADENIDTLLARSQAQKSGNAPPAATPAPPPVANGASPH